MAINREQDFISVMGFTKHSNIDFNMFHIKTKSLNINMPFGLHR